MNVAAGPSPPLGSNLPEYSVGDLARAVKRTVEDAFGYVRVRGEISQPKRHVSGHLYLRLKDETAVIEAVCWRPTVARLALKPEEGMEVICIGRLTTYPGRSQYQLVIESMELAGEGALLKMLEERNRRLAAEGLFDPARKVRLPFLPEVIGVVTSPTGAVIRDILHRLADRFPRRVLVWPVAVQGTGAAEQIAAAIRGFNALGPDGPVPRPDLLIVARGGGSLEDLMAFNEECVVRAVAAGRIPLISGVGHETDTTLIDHAADVRAPTPTAAAELAVPVRGELIAQVNDCGRRLLGASLRQLDERRTRVEGLGRGLGDPRRLLETAAQRLDDRGERLGLAVTALLERRRAGLAELASLLRHPRHVLQEATARLATEARALNSAVRQITLAHSARLHRVGDRLSARGLTRLIEDGSDRCRELDRRVTRAAGQRMQAYRQSLGTLDQMLESLSYRRVLARGYAVVRAEDGRALGAAAETRPGQPVRLEFHDGAAGAIIHGHPVPDSAGTGPDAPLAGPPVRPRKRGERGGGPPAQGSLF